jgi:hypothetical protein
LHFAQSPDLQSVHLSITTSQNRPSTPMAYDTRTLYDDNLNPQPILAESLDTSDYKTTKLALRTGVQFHTGRELTSGDSKYRLPNNWPFLRTRWNATLKTSSTDSDCRRALKSQSWTVERAHA